ncbi:uncharacterized protein LOC106772925 isoform X5 [Vigna radiata var. radiata]|uniref:Protein DETOXIFICATION n=1 Tax=Vigna radiata var. radiata TaxID=3916 RepID=A0A3Q0EYH3_VIGRR|nr:uncharacterized protein LOC106772925 isoform X5 [Vigna radiata var. radiata]
MAEPLLEKGGEQEVASSSLESTFCQELKRISSMAAPMVAVTVSQYLLQVVSLMMVGHLGVLVSFSGVAIATSFAEVTGFSVLLGMSGALETLCGQMYGAEEYRKFGNYTWCATVTLMLVCVPISLVWIFTDKILMLFGQDPEISRAACEYCIYLIPALFGYAILQALTRYFQTQSMIFPMVFSSITSLCLHIPICWGLVFTLGLGHVGAALAIGVSYWLNVVWLAIYILYSPACQNTKIVFSSSALLCIPDFLKLAIPSGLMLCFEWWSFEVLTLLAGLLPNPQLETAVLSICLNATNLHYFVPYAVGASASTRVSNELGAGNPKAAKGAVRVVVILAVAEAVVVSTVFFSCRHILGYAYSNDMEVVDYVASIAPLLCVSVSVDSLIGALSGIARGGGFQQIGAYVNLGAYYLVGIPIGLFLGFHLQLNAKGLWMGTLSGSVLQAIILAIVTALTDWQKEVKDQNLDNWNNTNASVPHALRHYYYHYLSSTPVVAEENITQGQESNTLLIANERLKQENESLLKDKDMAYGQITDLTKSLEALHKDLKDKENMVQVLKQSLENQRKDLHASRIEISKLKMNIERSGSGNHVVVGDVDKFELASSDNYKEEINKLQMEVEWLKEQNRGIPEHGKFVGYENETLRIEDTEIEIHEDQGAISYPMDAALDIIRNEDAQSTTSRTVSKYTDKHEDEPYALFNPANANNAFENIENVPEQNDSKQEEDNKINAKTDNANDEAISEKMGLRTIQILADALPKIVPYVLINHREELLPLMMCAIEHHPDSRTRDSLTHTLFNLIKRPDEQQRRIIMDACVSLAKNVGEMRTETELLPQCWEQINHTYEERRLLVAQSCGELAEFVRPEIRDSLILSIVQQLIEDGAIIVREAAAHNLAMLLPLFQGMDKYFQVSLTIYASRHSWRRFLTF